jgi:hypothetical protein
MVSPELKIKNFVIEGKSIAADQPDLGLVGSILEAIGQWQRNAGNGNIVPIQVPVGDEDSVEGLLTEMTRGFEDISDSLNRPYNNGEIERLDRFWRHIHPDFGASYQFQNSYARLLTRINGRGNIVKLDDILKTGHLKQEGFQQVDIEARVFPNSRESELRLTLKMPDILVSGRYHQRFLNAIRREKVQAKIIGLLQNSHFSKAALARFLEDFDVCKNIIFARIDYKSSEKNIDLVLIKGKIGNQVVSYLFEMRFHISGYPEVKVKSVKDIKLLYESLGNENPKIDPQTYQRIHRYLAGLFLILQYWKLAVLRNK